MQVTLNEQKQDNEKLLIYCFQTTNSRKKTGVFTSLLFSYHTQFIK